MMKSFRVFYFAWVSSKDVQNAYREVVAKLLTGLSIQERERIYEIINKAKKKNLTQDGKAWKERIVNRVLYCYTETMLHINLPLFKSFILVF